MYNHSSGRDIIDATQEAITEAAGSIDNIIKQTETAVEHEPFYATPEFWVGISFALVFVCLYYQLKKAFKSMFDKRIASIVKRIDDASDLKDKARMLLAEYEKKFENVDGDTADLLEKSKKNAERLKEQNIKEIEKKIVAQEYRINDMIDNARSKAAAKITDLISEKTIKILKLAISEKLSEDSKIKLIDNSIDYIGKLKK
jgi:F-type H+-transporting ATPase subunit b